MTCECGHEQDEHSNDGCKVEDCGCFYFDAAVGEERP